ncbi:MAG: hypothetical protein LBR47_02915, partial [Spirochaetaceae bacterium]|nr:hypothetical protein [Spirochaetaceae bacterium]
MESTEKTMDYSPAGTDIRQASELEGAFYSAREMHLDRAKKIRVTPIYPPPGYVTLGNTAQKPAVVSEKIPGLTDSAIPIREHGRESTPAAPEKRDRSSPEQGDSLIDPEDRREIEDQIEELSRKNRIALGPEQMKIKPMKKGGLFILLVNLFIIALTAGVLWFVSGIFSRQETAIIRGDNAYTSVEGQLIQKLRNESDFRLSEKERELSELQNRLA